MMHSDGTLRQIGSELKGLEMQKSSIAWSLEEFEGATRVAQVDAIDSDDEPDAEAENPALL